MHTGHPFRFRNHAVVTVILVALIAITSSCSSSSSSPLKILEISADGAGLLPETDLYLNSALHIRFNRAVDRDSITAATFQVRGGGSFNIDVAGDIVLRDGGRDVVFVPRHPALANLADAGFKPGQSYRLFVAGRDNTGNPDSVIRAKGGTSLKAGAQVDFAVRTAEPYFLDVDGAPPEVVAIRVDLDGDGVLTAAEEFPAPFSSGSPFTTDVRTGSRALPQPNGPLLLGFRFSEPLDPRAFWDDQTSTVSSAASLAERDRLVECSDPEEGVTCPRPLPISTNLLATFSTESDAFVPMITLEAEVPLKTLEPHLMSVLSTVTDLVGNALGTDVDAAFVTGAGHGLTDTVIEDFEDRDNRDPATTALWNVFDRPFLQAGLGWGGDASDGELRVFDDTVLDTTGTAGVWNLSRIVFDSSVPQHRLRIVGDKPATLRVFEDLQLLGSSIEISLNGEDGEFGLQDNAEVVAGGAPGAGGGRGGDGSPELASSIRGGSGVSPPGFEGGGAGGFSDPAPGGGGGGAHVEAGENGHAGRDGGGSGGEGGDPYDGMSRLIGGSGGGGGGNFAETPDQVSSGGGGGGGGGALLLEVRGSFVLRAPNSIHANGGRGGTGARVPQATAGSGGGGGGSGGTIHLRVTEALGTTGEVHAVGGNLGLAIRPAGRGGRGSDGAIRFETLIGTPTCNCRPATATQAIDESVRGVSFGRSAFFVTNFDSGEALYRFDGSNPATGEIVFTPAVRDLILVDAAGAPITSFPDGIRAFIYFSGADEDSTRPGRPDPSTITPWTTDIRNINGLPLIRYQVRFQVPEQVLASDYAFPGVDNIRLRYSR